MIVDIGHIALQVTDLDAAVELWTELLGMHEVERVDGIAYLTLGSPYPSVGSACAHHVVQLSEGPVAALDHVGLLARGAGGLEQVTAQAMAAGATVLPDSPGEPGLDSAVRLAAPTGHVVELYTGMDEVECAYAPHGVRPHRLGHATFASSDVGACMTFIVDGLGFSLSDWVVSPAGPIVGFARCHFDHHTLGALGGPVEGLHHVAFEVPSAVEVGRLGDCLMRAGQTFAWGPVRHGAGDNVAAYFDAAGVMVELYADMHKIVGDSWQPRTWPVEDPRALNYWTPPVGFEALMAAHVPLASLGPDSREETT